MSDYTEYINEKNVANVRRQIALKQGSEPYWSTESMAKNANTDYDVFPYIRWFRGNYKSHKPIVAEREAGYRKREDNCYRVSTPTKVGENYPDHCFETPCSTVFPCYPKYAKSIQDRDELNVFINKACIMQYR
jgi:hypothetical protein